MRFCSIPFIPVCIAYGTLEGPVLRRSFVALDGVDVDGITSTIVGGIFQWPRAGVHDHRL